MQFQFILFLGFPYILFSQQLDSLLLPSKILEQSIQVFTLDYSQGTDVPIFYFTDGMKWMENGAITLIDSLTQNQEIKSAKYVWVSTIDPETQEDLRNDYFFCNENYVHFFEQELIPKLEQGTNANRKRYLVGVSFGGLNAAFFAAKSSAFDGYALLSPITYPCSGLNEQLLFSAYKDYKLYMSTGKTDAEHYMEELHPIFQLKTKKIKLINTPGGHDFQNWNNQLLHIMNFLTE